MAEPVDDAILSFLLEDVILTLGTVQGALVWLKSDADCPPAARAEGFARLSRQIAALEDRARELWAEIQRRTAPLPEHEPWGNLFAPAWDEDALDACAFRSRRASA